MGSEDQICSGDVLLFRGNSFIAWAIRAFDGTSVNHAALALESDLMGEADGGGLQTASISSSIKVSRCTIVRRHLSDLDPTPVVLRGQAYLQGRVPYAYQQIVLLAILTLTRRIPLPPIGRRLVRAVLDQAAATLNELVENGRQLMICSEFVFRCYDEAYAQASPNPYRLMIMPAGFSLGEDTLLQWALGQNNATLPPVAGDPTFGLPADPAGAEERLAPLIAAYAAEVGSEEDLPAVPPVYGLDDSDVPDQELLRSVVTFAALFADATKPSGATFGGGDSRDALERVRALTTDPNFVTPGDLLKTASLIDRLRIADS